MCASLSLSLSLSLLINFCLLIFVCFVFVSFDGSETLIKINITGFALHPTNVFSPRILRFFHSSPGMFGIGSLLPRKFEYCMSVLKYMSVLCLALV